MRFWFSGPRIFGVRPGVSFGPQDFRQSYGPPPGQPGAQSQQVGFVYVVDGIGPHVKVGMSTDPGKRLSALQTGSPAPLRLAYVGAVAATLMPQVEARAHELLNHCRVSGEWFACTPAAAVTALTTAAAQTGAALAPITVDRIEDLRSVVITVDGVQQHPASRWPWKTIITCTTTWLLMTGIMPDSAAPLAVGIFVAGYVHFRLGRALGVT